MKCNMGSLDRTIRIVVALIIAGLILSGRVGGAGAVILGVLAAVFRGTSLVRFCPLYVPFKIDTRRDKTG